MGRAKHIGKVEPVQKLWLSTAEACAYLDCSLDYMEKLRNNAEVSYAQDGRKIWYDIRSIDRFLNRKKVV